MRADLAALTQEAVTALANAGLVKRALREIAEGKGPVLAESTDGVVTGDCPDGASVRWPPSTSLRDATCSCGAAQACRHRVAVALAYKAWEKSTRAGPVLTAAEDVAPVSARALAPWSPGEVDDAALLAHLGARTMEVARTTRSRGIIARVRPATNEEPIPSVALPSCTVRFLAPREIAFARCDCQVAEACAHIALAVWAFRALPSDHGGGERTLELSSAKASVEVEAIEPLRALARWVVGAGVTTVAASDAFAQRAALARAPLEARGYTWLLSLLEDLSALVDAYRRRAASYRPTRALAIVSEIEARARSASAPPHELPATYVVGRDTPLETRLDHLRLTSLGARVTVDSEGAFVRVLLANPETGDVLALDREFPAEEKQKPIDALAVAARRLGTATVGAVAAGHVVTRAAVRRANDALLIRTTAKGSTSVTPQSGDLSILPAARRAESADALRAELAARPPALLRPRRLGEDVFAIAVKGVANPTFDAAEQAVFASLETASGAVLLVRHHKLGADRALDAIASALVGRWGPVRWVTGEVDVDHGVLRIDPVMIVADRVIVPDFEPDPPRLELPIGPLPGARTAVVSARAELLERLVEVVHTGASALPPTFPDRLRRSSEVAAREGLRGLAARADALAAAMQASSADTFDRWCDAAIRAQLSIA